MADTDKTATLTFDGKTFEFPILAPTAGPVSREANVSSPCDPPAPRRAATQ